jgi:hypothetical protein
MQRLVLTIAALALWLGCFERASADTIIYQTGFENPPFSTGPLNGQDGWETQFTKANVFVQSNLAEEGSQAVQIQATGSNVVTGAFHDDPFDTHGSAVIRLRSYIYLQSSSTQSTWALEGEDSAINTLGGFDVFPDGRIRLVTPSLPIVTTPLVQRDKWYSYEVDFQFATQTFQVSINGSPIASSVPFFQNSTTNVFLTGIYGLSRATPVGNDSFFLDNYDVRAGTIVPELASLPLFLVGLMGVLVIHQTQKNAKILHAQKLMGKR